MVERAYSGQREECVPRSSGSKKLGRIWEGLSLAEFSTGFREGWERDKSFWM